MLLTKLEVKGFKSFGDRIVINFDEGVTGIVGQNGCGKSNVVDAIRWVLGEQSTKALRSDKMENIIFNGTKKRKPLNMAEVSLTFKNTKNLLATEYSEVTITRRLYRSGDSEYLLNNVTCRLKDITNLFLDTGIGSDSYAIIELKMVDDILNDKENSRRNLFEEAAGISKFKVRKKETMRKLKDTDQDLARVEDLLFEIDKNLKSLEKQAKKTERYYQAREAYKTTSILLARKSVGERQEAFTAMAKKIEEEQDKKLNLNKLITEKEAFVEKEKVDLIQKEKTLASRQKALNEYINDIRHYESEKKLKSERRKFLEDKQVTLQEQIVQDQQRQTESQTEIEKLTEERAIAGKILNEAQLELKHLQTAYDEQQEKTQQVQSKAQLINEKLTSQQQAYFQSNKDLEIKQTQITGLKQELEKFTTQNFERADSLAAYQDNLGELQEERDQVQAQLTQLETEASEQESQIEDIQHEIEQLRTQMATLNRQLDAKQNEYNLTKSLVDNLEGFPEAIKFLKTQAQWQQGAPLFPDILTCEESYKTAIENFLAPYINYYVVESEAEALQAVHLLHEAKKGKAQFFILEHFKQLSLPERSTDISGTYALEVVHTEDKYQPLLSHLLGRVYIVQEAQWQQFAYDTRATYITQNGKIIKSPQAIIGGSVGAFEGKRLGRAKNLEKLTKEIETLTDKIQQTNAQLSLKQQDLAELRQQSPKEQIQVTQRQYNQLNENIVAVRTKLEQLQNLIENSQSQKEHIEARIGDLEQEITQLTPATSDLQGDLQALKEEAEALNEALIHESELLNQQSGAFNQQNIRFHQQENRLQSIEQELDFKSASLDNLKARVVKNQEELERVKVDMEALTNKTELNDEELRQMYEEKERIEGGVNEAEKEYYAARGEIDTVEKEAKEIRRQREMTEALVQEMQQKVNETKLSLTSIKERLSVEFNVNLEELMQNPPAEEAQPLSLLELEEKAQKLKKTIDNIGPINPMAMEAYQEMKERYDFINGQKADLTEAKNSLLTTIDEIDQVATENFLTTFEQIRMHFKHVFRSLFTEEDTCDLTLSNPESPLESSIIITAKPKGKRPLTINQLSGGEKTLTATSLLFAIYLIKPAPFCIFDEVDAPLDDANVDKFTNIIRRFSEESQFIIVTHNKRTMTATDVMYGVTMYPEDPGVSKLVPVDLRGLVEAN